MFRYVYENYYMCILMDNLVHMYNYNKYILKYKYMHNSIALNIIENIIIYFEFDLIRTLFLSYHQ